MNRCFQLKHASLWILISAAFLGLVPIINGFPLFFQDSGAYINEAVRFTGILDRPPFYSIFLRLLHQRISLWPIPFAQDLIVCCAVFRILPLALPGIKPSRIALVLVATGMLTSLPWFSNQIMPDIYTSIIVLVIFALCLGFDRLGSVERYFLSFTLLAMIAFHQANSLFALLMLTAALLLAWRRGVSGQVLLRSAALVVVPLGLAMLGQALYSYRVVHRFTPAPYTPFFMLSRLLEDGPAHRYLAMSCPTEHYTLCRYQDTLQGGNDFMWSDASPRVSLIKERGRSGALDEAEAIVVGTVHQYPGEVLRNAVRDAAAQLVHTATLDGTCCRGGWSAQVVADLFPWEYSRYTHSLQYRGELPSTVVNWVDGIVLIASGVFLVVMALTRQRILRGDAGLFLILIAWAYLVNGVLMGALSMVTDRYQARIAWLIPFFVLSVLAQLRDSTLTVAESSPSALIEA